MFEVVSTLGVYILNNNNDNNLCFKLFSDNY